jgi:hypothetical protein
MYGVFLFEHTQVNVLTLFYSHRRGHQLRNSLQWVRDVLLHRAYLDGTRYYDKPERCDIVSLSRICPLHLAE